MRTETAHDQDLGLKATVQVCTAYAVVSLSTTSLDFITPPLTWTAPFDARLVKQTRKKREKSSGSTSAYWFFTVSTSQALVQTQSLVLKRTSICSLSSCHHRTLRGEGRGLKVLAKWGDQSVSTKCRAASCQCFAPCSCFPSCSCCHDPFIVRSAQPRPPFTGFSLHIRFDVHD